MDTHELAYRFEPIQAVVAMLWKYLSAPKRAQARKVLLQLREAHRAENT